MVPYSIEVIQHKWLVETSAIGMRVGSRGLTGQIPARESAEVGRLPQSPHALGSNLAGSAHLRVEWPAHICVSALLPDPDAVDFDDMVQAARKVSRVFTSARITHGFLRGFAFRFLGSPHLTGDVLLCRCDLAGYTENFVSGSWVRRFSADGASPLPHSIVCPYQSPLSSVEL